MPDKSKYFSYAREELLQFVPSTIRTALDIGCGMGAFAESIQKLHGAEVWGIEPTPDAAEVAKQKIDKVYCGLFDDVIEQLPLHYFDCIIFNDVLEHMIYPETALNTARNYLSTNGVILCSIPNIRYFPQLMELVFKRDWKYCDQGVLDRTHLRFFTRKSMVRMFRDNDFAIIRNVGINKIQSINIWP